MKSVFSFVNQQLKFVQTFVASSVMPQVLNVVNHVISVANNLFSQGVAAGRTLIDTETLSVISKTSKTKKILLYSLRTNLIDYVLLIIVLEKFQRYFFNSHQSPWESEQSRMHAMYFEDYRSILSGYMMLDYLNRKLWVNLDNYFYTLALVADAYSDENPNTKNRHMPDKITQCKIAFANGLEGVHFGVDRAFAETISVSGYFLSHVTSRSLFGNMGSYLVYLMKGFLTGRSIADYFHALYFMQDDAQQKNVRQNQGYLLALGILYSGLCYSITECLAKINGAPSSVIEDAISNLLMQYFIVMVLYHKKPFPNQDKSTDIFLPLHRGTRFLLNKSVGKCAQYLKQKKTSIVNWEAVYSFVNVLNHGAIVSAFHVATLCQFNSRAYLVSRPSVYFLLESYQNDIMQLLVSLKNTNEVTDTMLWALLKIIPKVSKSTLSLLSMGPSYLVQLDAKTLALLTQLRPFINTSSKIALYVQKNKQILIQLLDELCVAKRNAKPQESLFSQAFMFFIFKIENLVQLWRSQEADDQFYLVQDDEAIHGDHQHARASHAFVVEDEGDDSGLMIARSPEVSLENLDDEKEMIEDQISTAMTTNLFEKKTETNSRQHSKSRSKASSYVMIDAQSPSSDFDVVSRPVTPSRRNTFFEENKNNSPRSLNVHLKNEMTSLDGRPPTAQYQPRK